MTHESGGNLPIFFTPGQPWKNIVKVCLYMFKKHCYCDHRIKNGAGALKIFITHTDVDGEGSFFVGDMVQEKGRS